MRRVIRQVHGLALGASVASGSCASPAPPTRAAEPIPTASEWTGSKADAPAREASGSDPGGGWVLHIGDSFVHASLWQNLRPRFRKLGTNYVVQGTTATYTTTWASDPELDKWLSLRPSLVLVTLGANEVDMLVPDEHARAIEAVSKKVSAGGASCVWITPPMWKADTGILAVIHDHCAPCLYFDSDAVLGGLSAEERQKDRIHPNHRGGERWAGAFWEWLTEHRDAGRGGWALVPFERRGGT